ncbi:MAG: class F sortase [Minisyncoccia bacterium]
MQSKISLKWSSSTIGIVGIALSVIFIFFLTLGLFSQSSYAGQIPLTGSQVPQKNLITPVEQAGSGLPVRLKIPRIKVDAAVKYAGITSQGAMDVPKGPSDVSWFGLGPHPGDKGSAVIAGHYGWKNGIPAAFDNLSKLRKGDKIYVKDEKGMTTTFVVRELRTYGEKENASAVFVSSDGKAHLNLITCGGVWDKNQKSYSNRLVVFTDKEIKITSL